MNVFFFKQKTAYELRISYWSSDVFSSDLRGLVLVGGEDHDDVRPFGGVGVGHHLEAGLFGLLSRGRAFAKRDRHVLDARIAQILRMGVALAAIADDRDLLVGDEVQIGVAIVIDTPVLPFRLRVPRSEEQTSELQSLMRSSYAVFCL